MPMTEKECNGNLLDQLTVIERIECQLNKGGEVAAKEETETLKKKSIVNCIPINQKVLPFGLSFLQYFLQSVFHQAIVQTLSVSRQVEM